MEKGPLIFSFRTCVHSTVETWGEQTEALSEGCLLICTLEIILTPIPTCLTNVYSGNVSGALKFTSIFSKHYLSINMWVRKESPSFICCLDSFFWWAKQDLAWIWYLWLQNVHTFKATFPLRKNLQHSLPSRILAFILYAQWQGPGAGWCLVSSAPACSRPLWLQEQGSMGNGRVISLTLL